MRCAEFRLRLDAVLDARRAPQEDFELNSHARHCPKCFDWMNSQADLMAVVGSLATVSPRPDFGVQVLQQFEVRRRQEKKQRRFVVSAVALAASLLLAVVFPWRSLNWFQPGEMPSNSPTGVGAVAELQNHYLKLAQTTRHLANDIATPQIALAGEVVEGFKPVTRSVYGALQNLWRTLPGSDVAQSVL
jgi:predicted anti-sigma-YlaC factor YlaD